MGVDSLKGEEIVLTPFIDLINLSNAIGQIIANKSSSYISDISKKISTFLMSDKFIDCLYINQEYFSHVLFYSCEINEKFLFLKVLVPLIEELKQLKFEQQLIKLKCLKEKKENILNKIREANIDKVNKIVNKNYENENEKKLFQILDNIHKFVKINNKFLLNTIKILFGDDEFKNKNESEKKKNFLDDIWSILKLSQGKGFDKQEIKKETKELFDYFFDVSKLYSENILFKIIITVLYFPNNYFGYLNRLNSKILQNSEIISNLIINPNSNKNYNWILLDSEDKLGNITKEEVYTLEKREKEKPSINAFLIPKNINITNNNLVNGFPYESVFNKEYIIILEINIEKNNELNLDKIKNNINEKIKNILEVYPPSKDIKQNSYIKTGNKLIYVDESNKLYLSYLKRLLIDEPNKKEDIIDKKDLNQEELKNKENIINNEDNIIKETIKNKEEDIKKEDNELKEKQENKNNKNNDLKEEEKIKEENKINKDNELKEKEVNKEGNIYNEDNSLKEKEEDKELIKEIKSLQDELKQEKNKNKILEEKLNKYTREIDQLKEKEKIILEKEKVKETTLLQYILSQFPIELNEDEQLISIIFNSTDKIINCPILCKNTDKFFKVEAKLYKIYCQYKEMENYFTLNGIKIDKHKTLDENKIKNKDIIILNVV